MRIELKLTIGTTTYDLGQLLELARVEEPAEGIRDNTPALPAYANTPWLRKKIAEVGPELVRLWAKGWSHRRIAKRLGVSPTYVSTLLSLGRRTGLDLPYRVPGHIGFKRVVPAMTNGHAVGAGVHASVS